MPDRRRVQLVREALGDYLKFCTLLDIKGKSGQIQKLHLNEIQARYNAGRTQRDVVLKARQVGFTTEELARDIWHAVKVPGARVVAMCQSAQDNAPVDVLTDSYNTMFDGLKRSGLDLEVNHTAGQWTIPKRDSSIRIVVAGASKAAAAKKGRAGTVTRLHLTETAFYEYAEDTLNALLECVPTVEFGSEIVSESTPNGSFGAFYNQCVAARDGISGYKFHFFPWFLQKEYCVAGVTECKPESARERQLVERHGITPGQLLWYRRKVSDPLKGQALTDQEYPTDAETCFLSSGRLFFDRAITSALMDETVCPVETDGNVRIWDQPREGRAYLVAVDTAEGVSSATASDDPEAAQKGDYSTAIVYELGTGRHVASLRAHREPWDLAKDVAALAHKYNNATLVVERNNHGHAVLQALTRVERYPWVYRGADERPGWLSTQPSRAMALDCLQHAHRKGHWRSNDRLLLAEMLSFIITPTGRAEAARGKHDDLVMAAAIGWDVLCRPQAYRNFDGLPVA